jgi:hypothetical protein
VHRCSPNPVLGKVRLNDKLLWRQPLGNVLKVQ